MHAVQKKTSVTSNTQVLLGDTIGELNFLYSLADVAFVGGSLIDHGGQNLLEPSAQSLPLLSGPSLRNFLDISDQLKLNEGLTIVNNSKELSDAFIKYIADDQEIKRAANEQELMRAGNNAFEVFMKNRGALKRVTDKLELLLQSVI